MRKKAKRVDKTTKIKNLVRGAMSLLKAPSTPKNYKDKWRREQAAHHQINSAISLAKGSIALGKLPAFEDWVSKNSLESSTTSNRLGSSLVSLGLLPEVLNSATLAVELSLAKAHLASVGEPLRQFCNLIREFDHSFLHKDWQSCLEKINQIDFQHGESYWSIETRLAVVQAQSGLEALKAVVNQISSALSARNRFLFYYIGVRNEPAQSPSRFKEILKRRLDEAPLEEGIRTYFAFRLHGELGPKEKNISYVLAAEQLTTSIDLFFSSIKVSLWLSRHPHLISKAAQRANEELREFLKPLCCEAELDVFQTLADGTSQAKQCISPSSTRLNSAELTKSVLRSLLELDGANKGPQKRPMEETILRGIVSKLSTRSDGVAAEDLAKLSINLSSIPSMLRLGDLSEIEPLPLMLVRAFESIDDSSEKGLVGDLLLRICRSYWQDEESPYPSVNEFSSLSKVLAAKNDDNRRSAIAGMLQTSSQASNEFVVDTLLIVGAYLQLSVEDERGALQTMANAGLRNDRLVSLLPLSEIFQGRRWPRLKALGPSVDLSICLDLYLRNNDDNKIRTYKRFSIEDLSKSYECDSTISLLNTLFARKESLAKLNYLFHEVCDVYTMELLPGMSNSRKVLEERADLLVRLASIERNKELQYLREAADIREMLNVNDGLDVLDDSRVYVDEPRILILINKELAADFQRYLNLVSAGIGVSDSLAEVLRNWTVPNAKTFHVPKNDADDLLTEMVFQIREKFLFDSAYGLDIHLSRRIRHGTIASQLRGPLEAEGLIGQRPKAGAAYDPPESIKQWCANSDRKTRDRIYGAFARFAESIDQRIAILRDEYFQVHQPSKTRGLFELSISAPLLTFARTVAQGCADISQFSKQCIAFFWLFLSQRVNSRRAIVELEWKKALREIFEKLIQELRSAGASDQNLIAQLQQIMEELNNRVAVIASWVRVPNVSVENKTYSIRHIVDVSIAVVTGQRPGFKPAIHSNVPDMELDTYGLSVVSDMLYIALDNVNTHSGKRIDNAITLDITFDPEKSLLSFNMVSEVEKGVRTPEKEAILENTRSKIAKRGFGDGARAEGKSGLLKLAAMVLQSKDTQIEFGFVDDEHFELKFQLSYVAANRASEQESAPVNVRQVAANA